MCGRRRGRAANRTQIGLLGERANLYLVANFYLLSTSRSIHHNTPITPAIHLVTGCSLRKARDTARLRSEGLQIDCQNTTALSLPTQQPGFVAFMLPLDFDCILQHISSGDMRSERRFVESTRANERRFTNITHSKSGRLCIVSKVHETNNQIESC